MEAKVEYKMKRSEAQHQLDLLAQAARAGKVAAIDNYPVLSEATHAGIPLWQLSEEHVTMENWPNDRIAEWYAYEAIAHLMLDDE